METNEGETGLLLNLSSDNSIGTKRMKKRIIKKDADVASFKSKGRSYSKAKSSAGNLLLNLSDAASQNNVNKKRSVKPHQKEAALSKLERQNPVASSNSLTKKQFQNKAGYSLEKVKTSSIFTCNPDIPSLSKSHEKGVSEPLFSSKTFDAFNLHPHLVSCLKSRLGITKATTVQEKAIPVLLKGRDVLVKSCTGSGKTLAYALPIMQKLQEKTPKIKRSDGIFALIVVPTRELAVQCFDCLSILSKAFTWIVPGYLIGGEKKKSEKARLRKGINILICTPGRLLDHLDSTACLTLEKIQFLIIDEADRLLEQGFEESVKKVVSKCPQYRQTALLSATLSKGVERLAGMSLKNPVNIDVASENGTDSGSGEFSLPSSLKQSVVVVPTKLRLAVMSAFIIDNYLKNLYKGLIFMCTQHTVDFHYNLLTSVLVPLLKDKGHKCKFFKLHGSMSQEERTAIFTAFRSTEQGILLSTDVAARGLDLQHLDWILQTSAPISAQIYVHRVGRTARIGNEGSALLFLLPSETKFADLLSEHKIPFEVIDANQILESLLHISNIVKFRKKPTAEDCATVLQSLYEKEVYSEEELLQSAKEAFASYIQSYAAYPRDVKPILPFRALHLGHVAKSFCIREAPSQLGLKFVKRRHSKQSQSFRNDSPRKGQKRKISSISEYESGLSLPQKTKDFKKKKISSVSEHGSGLDFLKDTEYKKSKKTVHGDNSDLPFPKNRKVFKRKISQVSEYDSGLDFLELTTGSNDEEDFSSQDSNKTFSKKTNFKKKKKNVLNHGRVKYA